MMAAETLIASLFFLLGKEVIGVFFFVYLISAKLLLSEDPLCCFHPFLLIGLIVLRLYDSYDLFMRWKFLLGIPAAGSVLFHFLFYDRSPSKGKLSGGYLAVSVALALGGAFSIPAAHYFSGTSIYYAYGSGFGMLLLYSLLLRRVDPREKGALCEYVAKSAFYCGALCVFIIAVQYLGHLGEIGEGWQFSERRLSSISNNLSTTVLLTMPFAFWLSRKGGARGGAAFTVGTLEGIAALLSLSRGGMIFAVPTCFFLIVHTLITDKVGRRRDLILLAALCVAVGVMIAIFHGQLAKLYDEGVVVSGGSVKALFFGMAGLCLIVTFYLRQLFLLKDKKRLRAHLAAIGALLSVAAVLFFVKFDSLKPLLVKADYYRGNMMILAAENFKRYPFFGTGIGYRGLRGIYANKQGMFGCYHCLPVQIVGSMGLVGVAAYAYMFRQRISLLRGCKDRDFALAVFFSYLGILQISLVEPGIFCPLVYGLQITMYFIAAERAEETPKNPEK